MEAGGSNKSKNVLGLSECVDDVVTYLTVNWHSMLLLEGSDSTVGLLAEDTVNAIRRKTEGALQRGDIVSAHERRRQK